MAKTQDKEFLQMVLKGYEVQLVNTQKQIASLRKKLRMGNTQTRLAVPQKKHRISPEGRQRIADAQRRRWANTKKKVKES